VGIIDEQADELRRDHPQTVTAVRPDGTTLVAVPEILIPVGWSQSSTLLQFIVPIGYPIAHPDCFWADASLRLAQGSTPKNSAIQTPPFGGPPRLWFSWHLSSWNANHDTLRTYLRAALTRFSRLE